MRKKFFVIFNIIYMAFAAASCLLMLLMPLVDIKAGYTITPKMMEETVGKVEGIDYKDIVGENGTTINFSFKIQSKDLFLSYANNDVETFFRNEILAPNIKTLTNELSGKLTDVISKTISKSLSVSIKNGIKDAVKEEVAKFSGDNADQVMQKAGLTDEYFDNVAVGTYAKIIEKDATVTKVTDFAVSEIEKAYKKIGEAYPASGYSSKTVSPEMRADITKKLSDALKEIGMLESDGEKIKPLEEAIAVMLDEQLNQTKPSTAKTVDEVVTKYLNNLFTPSMMSSITLALKIVVWVIMFMILSWVIFLIFTLIRTLGKKKYTILGPLWWITFGLLIIGGLVPFIGGYVFNLFVPNIVKANPSLEMLSKLSFSGMTSLTIPSMIAIVMALSFIFYSIARKKAKKHKK